MKILFNKNATYVILKIVLFLLIFPNIYLIYLNEIILKIYVLIVMVFNLLKIL